MKRINGVVSFEIQAEHSAAAVQVAEEVTKRCAEPDALRDMAVTTDESITIHFHNETDAFAPQPTEEMDDESSREVWEDFTELCYPSGFVAPDSAFVALARERQPSQERSVMLNDENQEQKKRRVGGQSPVGSETEQLNNSFPHIREVRNHKRRMRVEEDRISKYVEDSTDQFALSESRGRSLNGNYDGEQELPNSDLNGKTQQDPTKTTKATISGGDHSESIRMAKAPVDLAEARKGTALPEIENYAELWYNSLSPGILTVAQAEVMALFGSMGWPSLFVLEAVQLLEARSTLGSHTGSQQPALGFGDWWFKVQGERLRPFQTKQTQEGDALETADGHVFTLGAEPNEQAVPSAEATAMSQPTGNEPGTNRGRGRPPGRDRGTAGEATIRGSGGRRGIAKRGKATTGKGGGARAGCHTPLARQVISGQIDWSQASSTLSMRDPSVGTSQNCHNRSSQGNEMQRLSAPQSQQPAKAKEQEYPNRNPRAWPSGFIPMSVMKMMAAPPSAPNQWQGGPRISPRGPLPGASYNSPQREEGRMAAQLLPRQGASQQAIPIKSQQLFKTQYVSGSRQMAGLQHSFAHGEGRHGEYGMRMGGLPSAAGGPQQAYPSPPQPPCKPVFEIAQYFAQGASQSPLPCPSQQLDMPYLAQKGSQQANPKPSQPSVAPHLAQAGPQQAYPSPSSQPAMPFFTQGRSQQANLKPSQQSIIEQLAQGGPQQAYPSPSLQPNMPYFTQSHPQQANLKPFQHSVKPHLAQGCPQQTFPSPFLQPTMPYFTQVPPQQANLKPCQQSVRPQLAQGSLQQVYPGPPLQQTMPYLAQGYPQQPFPSRSLQPAMLNLAQGNHQQAYPGPFQPPAMPQFTQTGPQQAYPIPFQQSANPPGSATARAPQRGAPPNHDEAEARDQSGQGTQEKTAIPALGDGQLHFTAREMKEFEAAAHEMWEALRVTGAEPNGKERF